MDDGSRPDVGILKNILKREHLLRGELLYSIENSDSVELFTTAVLYSYYSVILKCSKYYLVPAL